MPNSQCLANLLNSLIIGHFQLSDLMICYCTVPFNYIWAVTCDFQQCGILTNVDTDEPAHPPFKLRNSKWCSVSSLTFLEYSSDKQRLWSDCVYAQADLSLCWSHIPHCWKSHVMVHMAWVKHNCLLHFSAFPVSFSSSDWSKMR